MVVKIRKIKIKLTLPKIEIVDNIFIVTNRHHDTIKILTLINIEAILRPIIENIALRIVWKSVKYEKRQWRNKDNRW